jgi:hypothetical protein
VDVQNHTSMRGDAVACVRNYKKKNVEQTSATLRCNEWRRGSSILVRRRCKYVNNVNNTIYPIYSMATADTVWLLPIDTGSAVN